MDNKEICKMIIDGKIKVHVEYDNKIIMLNLPESFKYYIIGFLDRNK